MPRRHLVQPLDLECLFDLLDCPRLHNCHERIQGGGVTEGGIAADIRNAADAFLSPERKR